MSCPRDSQRLVVRIHKLLAKPLTCVEPRLNGGRFGTWCLLEHDDRVIRRVDSLGWDGHQEREGPRVVSIRDLQNLTALLGISQLEPIGSGWERDARYLHWCAERDVGELREFVRLRRRTQDERQRDDAVDEAGQTIQVNSIRRRNTICDRRRYGYALVEDVLE
jgi:hypothetical protein